MIIRYNISESFFHSGDAYEFARSNSGKVQAVEERELHSGVHKWYVYLFDPSLNNKKVKSREL
jgi:hypothetical protein